MAQTMQFGTALSNVYVHKEAKTSSSIIRIIPKGSVFSVYKTQVISGRPWAMLLDGWVLVVDNGGQRVSIQELVDNTLTPFAPTIEDTVISNDTSSSNTNTNNNTNVTEDQSTTTTSGTKSNKTMRLFGSPFQFSEYTDHRSSDVSDFFGKKYAERVVAHAPYITIIPGDADYLGDDTDGEKEEDAGIIYNRVMNDGGSGENSDDSGFSFDKASKNASMKRYYNFKENYTGYISRVNLTLRTMAVMLGLGDIALPVYSNGSQERVALAYYDWGNYRWDAEKYSAVGTLKGALVGDSFMDTVTENAENLRDSLIAKVGSSNIVFQSIFSHYTQSDTDGEETLKTSKLSDAYETRNYIQFYIDPSATDATDSFSNQTSPSKLRDIFEGQQSTIKEMAFIANTSGMDVSSFGEAVGDAIDDAMSKLSNGGGLKGILGRVAQAAGNVIAGENIVLPDVYQSSSKDTSGRRFKINLYSPYGTPLSIYLNILVPIGFLLCLTAPANKSANTYEAPPLVKVFYDGVYSCSLGIVQSLSIVRDSADWTADGLPTSASVDLEIKDLYSDLSVNSADEDVELFMHNSSLAEFLLTQCGLSMISYNADMKAAMRWNTTSNLATSTFSSVSGRLAENVLNTVIRKFKGIL